MNSGFNIIQARSPVVLYKAFGEKCILYPGEYNRRYQISHFSVVGMSYGTNFKEVFLLKPNISLYTETNPRKTQILFEPDISLIITNLSIQKGFNVLESGTGSGNLTRALSSFVGEAGGKVSTVEKDLERFEYLKNLFVSQNIKNIELLNGDLKEIQFQNEFYNAVVLDLPKPEEVIEHVYSCMSNGGRLCIFFTGTDKIIKVREKLYKYFQDITLHENIRREYGRSRSNQSKMKSIFLKNKNYSHTGFLIFATKVNK